MWVRGLKHGAKIKQKTKGWSHPMWVRGLKLLRYLHFVLPLLVAPHVGAWIETWFNTRQIGGMISRTPCGCVD